MDQYNEFYNSLNEQLISTSTLDDFTSANNLSKNHEKDYLFFRQLVIIV